LKICSIVFLVFATFVFCLVFVHLKMDHVALSILLKWFIDDNKVTSIYKVNGILVSKIDVFKPLQYLIIHKPELTIIHSFIEDFVVKFHWNCFCDIIQLFKVITCYSLNLFIYCLHLSSMFGVFKLIFKLFFFFTIFVFIFSFFIFDALKIVGNELLLMFSGQITF